jgi:hypothetical protein
MINKQTTLALNGPILSFVQSPSSTTVGHGSTAVFSGIATATFPAGSPGLNDGSITYRWYVTDVTEPLSDGSFRGATLSGTATTTLTVSGVTSPTTNQSSFFLQANYTPSAYSQPTGSPVTAGTARSTGRDVARGIRSTVGILTVTPFITITTQPQSATAAIGGQVVFDVTAALSDTRFGELSYQWQLNEQNLTDSSSPLISGSRSRTLIYSPTAIGTYNLRVIVTNTNAQQVISNVATLTVVNPRSIIVFEGYTAQNAFQKVEANLDNAANYTLSDASFNNATNIITFYASENDIDAEVSINAAKGIDRGSFTGGNGGSSTVRFTLQKNIEHTVLGITNNSAVFLYRGSNLIAVVGEGGDAGVSGNGGAGGGVSNAGQNGSTGIGGSKISDGALTTAGIFGSASTIQDTDILTGDTKATSPSGGRALSCSKGLYWTRQGISACANNGVTQFRNTDGTLISQSALITRGFKPNYTINVTEGAGVSDGGNGGGGATGGGGGTSGGGGGGGSGYTTGSLTTVLSSTIGGNATTKSTINFKIYVPPPPPPPPTPAPAPAPSPSVPGTCFDAYMIYRYGGGASSCSSGQFRKGRWYEGPLDDFYPNVNETQGQIRSVQDAFIAELNRPCGRNQIEDAVNFWLRMGSTDALRNFNFRQQLRSGAFGPRASIPYTTSCGRSFTSLPGDAKCYTGNQYSNEGGIYTYPF